MLAAAMRRQPWFPEERNKTTHSTGWSHQPLISWNTMQPPVFLPCCFDSFFVFYSTNLVIAAQEQGLKIKISISFTELRNLRFRGKNDYQRINVTLEESSQFIVVFPAQMDVKISLNHGIYRSQWTTIFCSL